MSTIENIPYDDITIGQAATYTKQVTEEMVQAFAHLSGDVNPVHLDEEFAKNTQFKGRISHGMLTGALISAALALKLPGPGSVYLKQDLKFTAPVMLSDTITVELTVAEKRDDRRFVTLDCKAVNQDGKTVATGTAVAMAAAEKLSFPAPTLPTIQLS